MTRLVINPGSPAAWEIHLEPGANSLGRGQQNDFQITAPSVSGSYCQIVVDTAGVFIRDLGSTNGTFVNHAPVKESPLQPDQVIHLGNVAMALYSDSTAPPLALAAQTAPMTAARTVPAVPVARITGSPPVARVLTPAVAAAPPSVEAPPPIVAAPSAPPGPHPCQFHRKSPRPLLLPPVP